MKALSKSIKFSAIILVAAGAIVAAWMASAAEQAFVIPPPAVDNQKMSGPTQTAVLAGGCFWGVQGVYQHVRGVKNVLSGYSGGDKASADYEVVSTGRTGHAESVQITFDPNVISYGEILRIYFSVAHDPTQFNRQGPDVGTQYRSAIFYSDETQKNIAEKYIAQLNHTTIYGRPIVTRVDPLKAFYVAENYHQDYLINNPHNPYIVYNDLPKIVNLKQTLPEYFQGAPVTVKDSKKKS